MLASFTYKEPGLQPKAPMSVLTPRRRRRRKMRRQPGRTKPIPPPKQSFSMKVKIVKPAADVQKDIFLPDPFPDGSPLFPRMIPIFRIMQFFGYGPLKINKHGIVEWKNVIFLRILGVMFILLNLATVSLTVYVFTACWGFLSILHVLCIASIITGVKPLHNLINLFIFAVSRRRHQRMLKLFHIVDCGFRDAYRKSPPTRCANITFIVITLLVGMIVCSIRILEYILCNEQPGDDPINDISIVFVIFLALWEFVPIFYFMYLNNIIRFWFRLLENEMRKDRKLEKRRMQFYYEQYLQLTTLLTSCSELFNSFLFFSLVVSILVLCLTIYFVTQFQSLVYNTNPSGMSRQGAADPMATRVQFQIIWSSIQILVSLFYVFVICTTGTQTNERSRQICRTVLTTSCEDDNDRHYALWFLQKVQFQNSWGLSVWRAFPLERPLLFTILSLMGTYAILLMRLGSCMDFKQRNGNGNGTYG